MKKSRNTEDDAEGATSEINLADEVDSLFKLPLPKFTDARNNLAARLKRSGRADDASLVKAMARPSVSAWAVNQLHWNHREEFDQLLAAGQRLRQAQASRTAGTGPNLRESIEARREALSRLSELASALLRNGGHNPTPDTIHRIMTTLEALSAYASLPDGPAPGRLSRDLDPPGFDSLAALMAEAITTKAIVEQAPVTRADGEGTGSVSDRVGSVSGSASPDSGGAATKTRQKASPERVLQNERQLNDARQARIAAAKASLQEAERSLTEARARAERLDGAHAEADEEADRAAKELRESEERLKKATVAARNAALHQESVTAEAKEAAKAVEDASHAAEKASKELESLIRESPGQTPQGPALRSL